MHVNGSIEMPEDTIVPPIINMRVNLDAWQAGIRISDLALKGNRLQSAGTPSTEDH